MIIAVAVKAATSSVIAAAANSFDFPASRYLPIIRAKNQFINALNTSSRTQTGSPHA